MKKAAAISQVAAADHFGAESPCLRPRVIRPVAFRQQHVLLTAVRALDSPPILDDNRLLMQVFGGFLVRIPAMGALNVVSFHIFIGYSPYSAPHSVNSF